MKYRPLANTGVYVSELCLGAMTFGSRWEVIGALDQKEADALVHRSIEAGVNFFDTADVYSTGDSEEILGRSLASKRHDVVIATKVRGRMGPGANEVGLSRLHIIQAARCQPETSRDRLHRPLSDPPSRSQNRHRRDTHVCLACSAAGHGRGPIGHMFLGSVAEKVVRQAPCPVLTVRHPRHESVSL